MGAEKRNCTLGPLYPPPPPTPPGVRTKSFGGWESTPEVGVKPKSGNYCL